MFFLYIIQNGRKGAYKIGIAKNVERRLDELQTGNPVKLNIVARFDFGTKARAFHAEKQLHKIFYRQRVRGEWFSNTINLRYADKIFRMDMHGQLNNVTMPKGDI